MNTVAVIQARLGSTRMPGKVLKELADLPILGWSIRAAKAIPGVDSVVIATSTEARDDAIEKACAAFSIPCFRGSETDVLARVLGAAESQGAKIVFRLTADCPLLDPALCGAVLQLFHRTGADYATNAPATWPDGLDCEVMTIEALRTADKNAKMPSDREHVTPYIRNNRHLFRCETLRCPIPGLQNERWTIDNEGDFQFLNAVCRKLPKDRPPSYCETLDVLNRHSEFYELRIQERRNAGYEKSIAAEQYIHAGYTNSNELIKRAEQTIPLGSQTFSKSRIQFPERYSPLFVTHASGGTVWDVDGNKYVDLILGLLPTTLGHCDPDVDNAIERQLSRGISFSMATELEMQLAERLREIIPCAEMTRFGKNGTDATSAAIRLSRAYTGREHVVVCGYHGWQDWYIGSTTRHLGVPECVRELTHKAPYNDLPALENIFAQHKNKIAAVIMEPVSAIDPAEGYLSAVKEMAHKNGSVLVFDEIITGFRVHLGGAQSYYGVTPDLATFGKGMGNGMPISAIVGRSDIMSMMEKIFYSGTFGGETLSLAASIAVIDKMKRENAVSKLWDTGRKMAETADVLVKEFGLAEQLKLIGLPPWKVLQFSDHETASKEVIKTCFLIEMLRNGVLIGSSHNICFAHTQADIDIVGRAYRKALERIASGLKNGTLARDLEAPPIYPIFQVRS